MFFKITGDMKNILQNQLVFKQHVMVRDGWLDEI